MYIITINNDRKVYKYTAELISKSESFEVWRVSGKNKSITLQNNIPVLKSRNLKHRKANWKLKDVNIINSTFLQKIIDELNKIV